MADYSYRVCDTSQDDDVVFVSEGLTTTGRNEVNDITFRWLRECTSTWLTMKLTRVLDILVVGCVLLLIICAVTQNVQLWDKAFDAVKEIIDTAITVLFGYLLGKLDRRSNQ